MSPAFLIRHHCLASSWALCFSALPLGWPDPTPHFSPTREGWHSATTVTARSVPECSNNFRVHPPSPFSQRGAWGCSCLPSGPWSIFIHNNKGVKTQLPKLPSLGSHSDWLRGYGSRSSGQPQANHGPSQQSLAQQGSSYLYLRNFFWSKVSQYVTF